MMMKTFPEFPDLSDHEKLILTNTSEDPIPVNKKTLKQLIAEIETAEGIRFHSVELVYVDEEEIIEINSEYLQRDYITDIISFRYDEDNKDAIEGTLYCCAPRIREQSNEFNTPAAEEFYRIYIHGLLHLAGYIDQTKSDKERMTKMENTYINMIKSSL